MNPESFIKSGREEGEQVALFCWFAMQQNHFPQLMFAYAIPNGGMRDKITASKLKAQGVRAGVPDICIPIPWYYQGRWYAGLYIELKKVKGGAKRDPDQLRWATFLKEMGYAHFLCLGYTHARDTVKAYFGEARQWRDEL